jgi:hypothetical protein
MVTPSADAELGRNEANQHDLKTNGKCYFMQREDAFHGVIVVTWTDVHQRIKR